MPAISPKFTAVFLILVLAVSALIAPPAAAPVARAQAAGDIITADSGAASKIHPVLRAAVSAAALGDAFDVIVYAQAGADLSGYLDHRLVTPYVWPNGTQTVYGRLKAANVAKLASLPAVAAIEDLRYVGERPQVPDLGAKRLRVTDPSTARSTITALKAEAGVARPEGARPAPAGVADWFDVLDVHKSKAAWDLGYTGEGVKVLVNDTGTDFSHPDLQGTIARIDDPASPYNGWPEMFDSFSMLNLAYDYFLGTDYIKIGRGHLRAFARLCRHQRRPARRGRLTDGDDGTLTAIFSPINAVDTEAAIHTKFPATSKSGVYHFGSHPDTTFEAFFDERAAVLVVDENAAGVYDTVYVDLDADYDFTNNRNRSRATSTS